MKKGFTLVELLGVIVILGVVLVIAVPKITGVIEANKEESFFLTAKNILREIEYESLEGDVSRLSLDNFDLTNIDSNSYDLSNSYVYTKNNELYIDLKGANKYSNMSICGISAGTKNFQIINECSNAVITLSTNLNGGSTTQIFNETYSIGEVITLIEPTKEGQIFTGWIKVSGNSVLSGNSLVIGTSDTTIKATWGGDSISD